MGRWLEGGFRFGARSVGRVSGRCGVCRGVGGSGSGCREGILGSGGRGVEGVEREGYGVSGGGVGGRWRVERGVGQVSEGQGVEMGRMGR